MSSHSVPLPSPRAEPDFWLEVRSYSYTPFKTEDDAVSLLSATGRAWTLPCPEKPSWNLLQSAEDAQTPTTPRGQPFRSPPRSDSTSNSVGYSSPGGAPTPSHSTSVGSCIPCTTSDSPENFDVMCFRCPQGHNNWDSVETKKGGTTKLRCRTCWVEKVKEFRTEPTSFLKKHRCEALFKLPTMFCACGDNCDKIHIHRYRRVGKRSRAEGARTEKTAAEKNLSS